MPHKTNMNPKGKPDPFRPQPHLRIASKSRRHHPVMQRENGNNFCIRGSRCKNKSRKGCDECVPLYRNWEEK